MRLEHYKNMFWVYLLASQRNGTIYVGHTDELAKRVWEHRQGRHSGFTTKYGVADLVWFEGHPTRDDAFKRERRIKEWRRSWKVMLIEDRNPEWRDLLREFVGAEVDAAVWLASLAKPGSPPG